MTTVADTTTLDEMDRDELLEYIEENEIEVKVKKKMSDDDVRALITEAVEAAEEDEDEDDEEDEVEDTGKRVKLSNVYAKYAKAHDIDTTRAAKLVRARLRSNFDKVCKLDPQVKKAKKTKNDKARWPETISKDLADFLK